jgi:hypothetical protein
MGEMTGLCFFLNGTSFTNCRGGEEKHEKTVSLDRTLLINGTPRALRFSIWK